MEPDEVFLELVRRRRICQRTLIFMRRTPEEWCALSALNKKEKKRFDRLERRWLYAKDLGPYPTIPGMGASTQQSSDANWTDASALYNAFYHGIAPQSAT